MPAADLAAPKYWKWDDPATKTAKVSDPEAQLYLEDEIPQQDPVTGKDNWREDGY